MVGIVVRSTVVLVMPGWPIFGALRGRTKFHLGLRPICFILNESFPESGDH